MEVWGKIARLEILPNDFITRARIAYSARDEEDASGNDGGIESCREIPQRIYYGDIIRLITYRGTISRGEAFSTNCAGSRYFLSYQRIVPATRPEDERLPLFTLADGGNSGGDARQT